MAKRRCNTCKRWFEEYDMVRSGKRLWYCRRHYVSIRLRHTQHEATEYVAQRIRAKRKSGEVHFRKKKCYLCGWPYDPNEMVDYPGGISVCGGCACRVEDVRRKKAVAKEHGFVYKIPREPTLLETLQRLLSGK